MVDKKMITTNLMQINKDEKSQEKEIRFINNTCLYNYSQLILENGKDIYLYTIDMRPLEKYNEKHFKNSIHENDENKLKEVGQKVLHQKNCIIVFYDDEEKETWLEYTENKNKNKRSLKIESIKHMEKYYQLIQKYFQNMKVQFYLLKEQFTNFEKEYPFLCLNEKDEQVESTNETTPRIIASINYPLQILKNIYLGNFIHLNNPYVFRYLKIKYVYDFTTSGFSKRTHHNIHYYRYDIIYKKLKKKWSEKQTCNYLNFLDNQFMHDIICHIAKNDSSCKRGKGKLGGCNIEEDTNMEMKTKKLNRNITLEEEGKEMKILNENDKYEDKEVKTEMEINKPKNKTIETENIEICHATENESKKKIENETKNEDINKDTYNHNENEKEKENKKEQLKDDAIIIVCNEGIKNQTKTKTNSISLIICMCYIMFKYKCNVNVVIACFLKICNSLEINASTFSFLKNFYNYLQKNNFCLEPRKKREKKERYACENNRKNEHESQSQYMLNQSGKNECAKTRDTQNESIKHSQDSQYYWDTDSTSENEENEINKKQGEQNVIEERKKIITNNLKNKEKDVSSSLLDNSRNFICKQIMCSLDVHKNFVILGNNKSNIIYINDNDHDNNNNQNKNEKNNELQKLINNEEIIHRIANKTNYDYQQMLVSILYNIYNSKITKIEDINIFLSVLFDAVHIEKHQAFELMPYISLILFNTCILIEKSLNALDLTISKDMEKLRKKINMDIVFLLQIYAKESIIYILHNLYVPMETKEFKITFRLTNEQLRTLPVDKHIYLILVALKYFLVTLLHFYIKPYMEKMEWSCFGKLNDTILKNINEFADYYYSKFKVDILKFLKPCYLPENDSHDNLPFYFSDILRPFILLNDYFT